MSPLEGVHMVLTGSFINRSIEVVYVITCFIVASMSMTISFPLMAVESTRVLASTHLTRVQPVMIHKVEDGDTLANMAQRFLGDQKYWRRLWQQNPELSSPDYLTSGMNIRIPNMPVDRANINDQNTNQGLSLIHHNHSRMLYSTLRLQPKIRYEQLPKVASQPAKIMSSRFLVTSERSMDPYPYLLTDTEIAHSPKMNPYVGNRLLTDVDDQMTATWQNRRKIDHPFINQQLVNIYRVDERLKASDSVVNLGQLIRQIGNARIDHIDGNIIHLTITRLFEPIYQDDFIIPTSRILRSYHLQLDDKNRSEISSKKNDTRIKEVLTITDGFSSAIRNQLVVINYGIKDGAVINQSLLLVNPNSILFKDIFNHRKSKKKSSLWHQFSSFINKNKNKYEENMSGYLNEILLVPKSNDQIDSMLNQYLENNGYDRLITMQNFSLGEVELVYLAEKVSIARIKYAERDIRVGDWVWPFSLYES